MTELASSKTKKIVAKCSSVPKRASDRSRESALELLCRQGTRAVGAEEIVTHADVIRPGIPIGENLRSGAMLAQRQPEARA